MEREAQGDGSHDKGGAAGVRAMPTTVVRNNETGASEPLVGAIPTENVVAASERMLNAKP